ncbi:MAG: hypothetical protein V3U53_04030 [bacterium]
MTKNTARSRDDVFEEVHTHFSDAEVVDLTLICAYFNMNNRFQDSLRIPIEDSDEVNKIKKTVRTNTNALKSYLETIIRDWPDEFPEPDSTAPDRGRRKDRVVE